VKIVAFAFPLGFLCADGSSVNEQIKIYKKNVIQLFK